LPAWLANLAVGGVAAAIVTANLEEVPLTGRMQLRLDCFQPRPREPGVLPRHVKSHPACQNAASLSSCRQHQPLSEQASDVMFETYKDVVRGAELLALQHPSLSSRLSTLPKTAELQYDADQLQSVASFSNGATWAWYRFWSRLTAKRQFIISMSAGSLLQHSSHNSLIWSMAHEAGHGIAKHLVEIDSWGLVSTVAIFSRLALSSIALLPAMALGCVLSTLTKKIVIDSWLCQQLEHEADVIGTAISRAAGCTPEDVMYAMSCWLDVHHINLTNLVNSGVWMKQRAAVAALNGYMPNARLLLPGIGGLDSRDMRRIMATIDKELCLASEDVKRLAHGQVNMLLVSIAESLCYTKNPLEPWLHSHPHKLDRIAHVKSSSYFADSAHQTMIVRGHDGEGQRLLEAFQAYPQWLLFVHSLEKALPGEERVKDMYITCLVSRDRAIRSRVLAASKAEAEREYDPSIRLLALLISVLEKAWAFWA